MFDESEREPFEVPTRHTKTYDLKNHYLILQSFLQYNNSACLFFLLSYSFYFISNKIAAGSFKDENTPYLNAVDKLNFLNMWN